MIRHRNDGSWMTCVSAQCDGHREGECVMDHKETPEAGRWGTRTGPWRADRLQPTVGWLRRESQRHVEWEEI